MSDAPPKYRNLLRAAEIATVPPTALLDESFFAVAIEDYDALNGKIGTILEEIAITSGAVIERQCARIGAHLEALCLNDGWPDKFAAAVGRNLPDWGHIPLAIRSAAWSEDGAGKSSAGIYESILDVRGMQALGEALLDVWRSYFRRAALVERLSSRTLLDGRRMCVMVQPMVQAKAAGVAFSIDPVTSGAAICEYTAGIGDKLVAGEVSGCRLSSGEQPSAADDPLGADGAAAVFETLSQLKAHFGFEIDAEWVWDGGDLHIVQVRPISTLSANTRLQSAVPVAHILPLYDSDEAALSALGPQPEYVRYFREKRRPLHMLSRELGLHCPPALILQANRAGLIELTDRLATLAHHEKVVIDASDQVRQMIVRGREVFETLMMFMPGDGRVSTIALRVFIGGDIGFISQASPGAGVVMEYSADGLLALNRGTAEAHCAIVKPDGSGRPDWLGAAGARSIIQATAEAERRLGRVQLEWVSHAEGLTLLDYSPLSDAHSALTAANRDIVSRGFAHAPVLRIENDASLADISEGPSISIGSVPEAQSLGGYLQAQVDRIRSQPAPPILVCQRPYALLAALIPYVSGFVFQSASLLSHLSILIRESGKPALSSPALFQDLTDGELFMLDLTEAGRSNVSSAPEPLAECQP